MAQGPTFDGPPNPSYIKPENKQSTRTQLYAAPHGESATAFVRSSASLGCHRASRRIAYKLVSSCQPPDRLEASVVVPAAGSLEASVVVPLGGGEERGLHTGSMLIK
jgi:hypothetical protein